MRRTVYACAFALLAVACTPSDQCTVGSQSACACPGGAQGVQQCLADHSLGACTCASEVPDLGDVDAAMDAAAVDASADLVDNDANVDAPSKPADLGVATDLAITPKKLVSGGALVTGYTDEGHVVYDTGFGTNVVKDSGGAPTQLISGNFKSTISHNVVFINSTNIGTYEFHTWTAAKGLSASVPASETGGANDGSSLVYLRNGSSLAGAASDLTGIVALASNVNDVRWVGDRLVSWNTPNGAAQPVVSTWDASWTRVDVATDVMRYAAGGGWIAWATSANDLYVAPIGGGTASKIASAIVDGPMLASDGSAVLYIANTGLHPLKRAVLPPASIFTIVADVFDAHLSPDNVHVEYSTMASSSFTTDIHVISSVNPVGDVVIDANTTNRFVDFTADGAYVLYEANYDSSNPNRPVSAQPIDGGTARVLGNASISQVTRLQGSRFLYPTTGNGGMYGGLGLADAAAGWAIELLPDVSAGWATSADGSKLAYGSINGVFVENLP